jgi:hypothetical protein
MLKSKRFVVKLIFGALILCAAFMAYHYFENHRELPRVERLVRDSKHRETLGISGVTAENPLTLDDLPQALEHINEHRNYTSYHLLMALRLYFPDAYKLIPDDTKAAILCSALREIHALNDWGVYTRSTAYDSESAVALLETREASLKYLALLLDDDSPATLYGSANATVSIVLKYRRKDFAFRYYSLINGVPATFFHDPETRDIEINKLRNVLRQAQKDRARSMLGSPL